MNSIFLSRVTISFQELHIERQYNSVLSSGSYLSSTDAFANPDADPKFCKEFDSHCCPQSSKCDNCSCNQQKLFLSYRHGCVEQKIASEMLGCKHSINHSLYTRPTDNDLAIFTIRPPV